LLRPGDLAQSLTAEGFERLRSRADDASVFLYGFDLLSMDGVDIRRDRLDDRRAKLRNLLARPDGDLTGRKRTKKKSSAGAEPSLGRNHWNGSYPRILGPKSEWLSLVSHLRQI
jgi:ATP-dependent DNA ligase